MTQNRLKFKYKLYLLSVIILSVIIGSHIISLYQDKRLSKLIYNLSNNNQALNSTLLNLSQVERLKYFVEKYQKAPNQENLDKINEIFLQLHALSIPLDNSNTAIVKNKNLLVESINQYQNTFQIASKQIPRNFQLRKDLRKTVREFKERIFELLGKTNTISNQLNLSLLLNGVLATERNTIRFLETDNADYIKKVDKFIKMKNQEMATMAKAKAFPKDTINELLDLSASMEKIVKQTIGHYRTYSMLTKVMMPGNANEINFYSQNLQDEIHALIDDYKAQIEFYHSKRTQSNALFSLLLSFVLLFGLFLIMRLIMKTFEELTLMFERLASGEKNVEIPNYRHNDEIGQLIDSAVKFQKLNEQTEQLLKETEEYKANLEIKVQEESHARAEQEKVLIQQSKLAAMGEMIGAIAHQWRQPLNELSVRIQKLKYAYARELIDEEYISSFIDKNNTTIQFMSRTIDDFRNFFRIDKEKTNFDVRQALEEVINIQDAQLKNHHIGVSLEGSSFAIKGFKGELQQAILNLMSNSKDALLSSNTPDPVIHITLTDDCKIKIQDNGGGIPEHLLDRVMDPYFTTKDQGEGTGMGLYMTKMIIEDNLQGKITIKNQNQGVLIVIDLGGLESTFNE